MTTGIQTEVSRLTAAKGAIAQAIEAKGVAVPSGTKLDGMATLINGIEQGSDPVLQSKTVTPSTSAQTVSPDSGYDGLSSVTVNAMPTATQATPSITVSSAGLITASATQSAGYVTAGTKSATKQLTTQAAKTVTPSTSAQTAVASGRYTTGAVTVAGDSNLAAGNIKSGVSIFGVAGTYEGSGGGSGGGGLTVETLSHTYELETMYEPGYDLIVITIDDSSVDLTECYVVAVDFSWKKSTASYGTVRTYRMQSELAYSSGSSVEYGGTWSAYPSIRTVTANNISVYLNSGYSSQIQSTRVKVER